MYFTQRSIPHGHMVAIVGVHLLRVGTYIDTVHAGAVGLVPVRGLVATPVEERGRFARVKQGKRVIVASVQVSSSDIGDGVVIQDAVNSCIPASDEVLHKLPLCSVVDLDKVSVVASAVRHVRVYVDL